MLMVSYPSMLAASSQSTYIDFISYRHMIRLLLGVSHLMLWAFSAAEFCFIELPILVNRNSVKTTEKPLNFLQKPEQSSLENTFSLFEGYYSHKVTFYERYTC